MITPLLKQARALHVTFFCDRFGQHLEAESLTLAALADLIRAANANRKDKLGLLKLAKFGNQRSDQNSLRHNGNVLAISGVETDYDGEQVSFEEAVATVRKAGLSALMYTSPRNTAAKPRWRILLPASCELEPGLRPKLVARVNGLFGGILASESFTLSQAYYYGSVNNNPDHRVELVEGDFIDCRDDLDQGAVGNGDHGAHECADSLVAEDQQEILVAAAAVDNPDLEHPEWVRRGMAIFAATKGSDFGRQAFHALSRKSGKYSQFTTEQTWRSFSRSPPTRIGAGTVIRLADLADRSWRDRYAEQFAQVEAELEEANRRATGLPETVKQTEPEQQETVEKPKVNPTQPQQQKQIKSRAVTIRASDVKMRAKKWLWKGHLLRAALELLAGIPGIGKSQVQIHYVACVTNPKKCPWPDGTTLEQPGNVIMVTAEDALDQEVVPRLIAAGADLDRVTFIKSHSCRRRQDHKEKAIHFD